MPYALCPMPYALCPMPVGYLIFLRKAIVSSGNQPADNADRGCPKDNLSIREIGHNRSFVAGDRSGFMNINHGRILRSQ